MTSRRGMEEDYMNDRYTSPALSRDLAAAGLEQVDGSPAYINAHQTGEPSVSVTGCECGDCAGIIRALDLTDCLHEIEKREASWALESDGMTYCCTVYLKQFSAVMGGPSAVEAAGLCLLALLDKLREAKP